MGCPSVVPLQFVTNGVCIDDFALCRHVQILIIVDCCIKKVLDMMVDSRSYQVSIPDSLGPIIGIAILMGILMLPLALSGR
jgi:hypothetical protein